MHSLVDGHHEIRGLGCLHGSAKAKGGDAVQSETSVGVKQVNVLALIRMPVDVRARCVYL